MESNKLGTSVLVRALLKVGAALTLSPKVVKTLAQKMGKSKIVKSS